MIVSWGNPQWHNVWTSHPKPLSFRGSINVHNSNSSLAGTGSITFSVVLLLLLRIQNEHHAHLSKRLSAVVKGERSCWDTVLSWICCIYSVLSSAQTPRSSKTRPSDRLLQDFSAANSLQIQSAVWELGIQKQHSLGWNQEFKKQLFLTTNQNNNDLIKKQSHLFRFSFFFLNDGKSHKIMTKPLPIAPPVDNHSRLRLCGYSQELLGVQGLLWQQCSNS